MISTMASARKSFEKNISTIRTLARFSENIFKIKKNSKLLSWILKIEWEVSSVWPAVYIPLVYLLILEALHQSISAIRWPRTISRVGHRHVCLSLQKLAWTSEIFFYPLAARSLCALAGDSIRMLKKAEKSLGAQTPVCFSIRARHTGGLARPLSSMDEQPRWPATCLI